MSLSSFSLCLSLTHSSLSTVWVGNGGCVTIIEEDIKNLRGYGRKTMEKIKVGRGKGRNYK